MKSAAESGDRASAVNPLDVLPIAVVLLADFGVAFLVVLLPWFMRNSFHLFELVCR